MTCPDCNQPLPPTKYRRPKRCPTCQKEHHNRQSREWHKVHGYCLGSREEERRSKRDKGHDRKCLLCGKVIHGPNWFYHPRCHSQVTDRVAVGFEDFSPQLETTSLFTCLFPGMRSGEWRKGGAA